tara:strand:+ start:1037 stop:1444 length:408 start_codon:yes stop_codon:yes gene_type:complete
VQGASQQRPKQDKLVWRSFTRRSNHVLPKKRRTKPLCRYDGPKILKGFSDAFPRVEVELISTQTVELKKEFSRGRLDLILTAESKTGKGGKKLVSYPLKWFCQRGDTEIWKKRPLPLAYELRWPYVCRCFKGNRT